MKKNINKISILGATSWGITLANILSENIKDIVILTRNDMEGARTRVNNQVDKGFVRSSNMANHPEIGY